MSKVVKDLIHVSVYYNSFNTRYVENKKVYEVITRSAKNGVKLPDYLDLVQHGNDLGYRRTDLSVPGDLYSNAVWSIRDNSRLYQQYHQLGSEETSRATSSCILNLKSIYSISLCSLFLDNIFVREVILLSSGYREEKWHSCLKMIRYTGRVCTLD